MRKRRLMVIVAATVASMLFALPAAANAATEYGSTSKWPWSGYWWPMLENGYNLYSNNGPLQKYDQYAGTNAKPISRTFTATTTVRNRVN